MRFLRYLSASLALMVVFSCEKAPQDSISITSDSNIVFPPEGGTATVAFTASGFWTAAPADAGASSWLSISPNQGTTDDNITLIARVNQDEDDRIAVVNITCGMASASVIVTQGRSQTPTPDPGVTSFTNPYAEIPVFDKTNADYYYNTLYANTVKSNKRVRNFSFCYDTRRHNPIWVAFPMHSIYAEGSGRSRNEQGGDPWMRYPDLPLDKQSIIWDIAGDGFMYWSASSSLITGGSWTKGHLCMSSSRAGSGSELNLQTFYPVNIAPQSNSYAGAGIFGTLWGETENLHWQRGSQICYDTLYVVAGCHYANDNNIEYDACNWNTRSDYSKACVMPTHQYKLLLRTRSGITGKDVRKCTESELKAIGFWFDSVLPVGSSADITAYAVSVSEIEKRTGVVFFPDIPAAVKSQCQPSDWGL